MTITFEDDDNDGAFDWRKQKDVVVSKQEEGLHLLRERWVFWVWAKEEGRGWRDGLHEQQSIRTIEDHYALQSRIKPLAQLGQGTTYIYFKEGIEPMWEHPRNERGGAFSIDAGLDRVVKLDRVLQEVLEMVLGAQLTDRQDVINGVEANSRRVRIWLATCDREGVSNIAEVLRKKLNVMNINNKIRFEAHNERLQRDKARSEQREGWGCG